MAPGLLRQVSLQSWMAWNAVCRLGLKLTPDPSQPSVLELQVRTTQLSPPPPSPPLLSCLFLSLSLSARVVQKPTGTLQPFPSQL